MNSIMLQPVIENHDDVELKVTNTIAEALQKYGHAEVAAGGGIYLELPTKTTIALVLVEITVQDIT